MKNNTDLTPQQIAQRLRRKIFITSLSHNKWAEQNGVDEAHVSRVLNCVQLPGRTLRDVLGIERVVVFRLKGEK